MYIVHSTSNSLVHPAYLSESNVLLLTTLVHMLFSQYLGDILRFNGPFLYSVLYKFTGSNLWDVFPKLREYWSGGVSVLNHQTPVIHILS